MTPTHYTKHRTSSSIIYIFHYKFSDLRKFLIDGYKYGNNGYIITRWDGRYKKMRGFGTIENPSKILKNFNIMNFPPLDEEFNPDEVINPKPNYIGSYGFFVPKNII